MCLIFILGDKNYHYLQMNVYFLKTGWRVLPHQHIYYIQIYIINTPLNYGLLFECDIIRRIVNTTVFSIFIFSKLPASYFAIDTWQHQFNIWQSTQIMTAAADDDDDAVAVPNSALEKNQKKMLPHSHIHKHTQAIKSIYHACTESEERRERETTDNVNKERNTYVL